LRPIERAFRESLESGSAALVGFLTAGDPAPDLTVKFAEALARGGVDVVELGIPFSDPVADGVTIQASTQRALASGTTPRKALELAARVKERVGRPLVILSYLNPIYRMGFEEFFAEASLSGVDGVVVPDLPADEAAGFKESAERFGVDTIFLAAPTTSERRLDAIIRASTGFVYLVSLLGVTGVRGEVSPEALRLLERVRARRVRPYAAVGFGVSAPEHVEMLVRMGAEGVIVGSALVKIIGENMGDPGRCSQLLTGLVSRLKEAARLRC